MNPVAEVIPRRADADHRYFGKLFQKSLEAVRDLINSQQIKVFGTFIDQFPQKIHNRAVDDLSLVVFGEQDAADIGPVFIEAVKLGRASKGRWASLGL